MPLNLWLGYRTAVGLLCLLLLVGCVDSNFRVYNEGPPSQMFREDFPDTPGNRLRIDYVFPMRGGLIAEVRDLDTGKRKTYQNGIWTGLGPQTKVRMIVGDIGETFILQQPIRITFDEYSECYIPSIYGNLLLVIQEPRNEQATSATDTAYSDRNTQP